jgi:hypothetical protein
MKHEIEIPEEIISSKIYLIRNQKVMLDRDLADLYGVETKRLKESVKRNFERFPNDFMFELNKVELENWRSQFASSNADKMGLRYSPYCFTEQGVAMLSSVLNSERAIRINIQIIRLFTRLRKIVLDSAELRLEVEQIKKKVNAQSQNIELVFKYLDELVEKKEKPRKRIGYRTKNQLTKTEISF